MDEEIRSLPCPGKEADEAFDRTTSIIDESVYISILQGLCNVSPIPYGEGRRAREEGVGFHESPYEMFTSYGLSWRIGWNDRAIELNDLRTSPMYDTENNWQPITSAPKNTWIEVCGDSGMRSPEHFLVLAIHDAEYRPNNPWRGVGLDALSDYGWKPLYWRKASPVPPIRTLK